MQLAVSFNSPVIVKARKASGMAGTSVDNTLAQVTRVLMHKSKVFFGITKHGVFMDSHFNGYNHIIAVTYKDKSGKEVFLPFIDENGMPGTYVSGFNWVKWTFRVNGPRVNRRRLKRGIRDFTAFWAHRNNVPLKNTVFNIKVKKVDTPKKWSKDFLRNQMARPWLDGGYVRWKNKKFHSSIKNIERI